MENIEDKKINTGIKELRELKITETEKETILKNILQISLKTKEVPIESPFNMSSFIFGTNLYVRLAVFLILIIIGGGFLFDFQNTKKQEMVAMNKKNTNSSQNSYIGITANDKKEDNNTTTIAIAPDNNINNNEVNKLSTFKTSDSNNLMQNSKSMSLSTSITSLNENDSQIYIDISRPVLEKWLKNLIKEKGGAESYIINNITYITNKESAKENEITWFIKESTKNAFIINMTYSIKMTSTNDYNYWMAGNGIKGVDNWILNKSLFITIDKNTNGYYVSNAGTSM